VPSIERFTTLESDHLVVVRLLDGLEIRQRGVNTSVRRSVEEERLLPQP